MFRQHFYVVRTATTESALPQRFVTLNIMDGCAVKNHRRRIQTMSADFIKDSVRQSDTASGSNREKSAMR
jgi:hypothetical protein